MRHVSPFEYIYLGAHVEQNATAIEESVKAVQKRVHRLMLRIKDAIPENGSVSDDLQASIKTLQSSVYL